MWLGIHFFKHSWGNSELGHRSTTGQCFGEDSFSWNHRPGKMYSSLWPAFLRPCKSCKEKWPFSHPSHHCLTSSWHQFHLQKVSLQRRPFLGFQIFNSHCFPCMLLLMAETQQIIMIFKNFPFFCQASCLIKEYLAPKDRPDCVPHRGYFRDA